MSGKGGAGKVYFILYLAVLLELLIIIVERDDAEDELRKEKLALEAKSKRIQLIAETIINSLRGSPTSVSSTSDQSMILGDEKEQNGREFSVKVRVADPARDSVRELDLHILRNESEMATINLAADAVSYPREKVGQDYIFHYAFKPAYGEGKYTLKFDAKTNTIVGLSKQSSIEDTVKIGAIHLTKRELLEVKDGITENVGLKGYIDSLLTGEFENFSSNLGSNDFTIDVKKKAATVIDQLSVYPTEMDFAAFPGLDLPNPVKIEGAEAKGVTIVNLENSPGTFEKVDTNWVWRWKPDAAAIGQGYTIKFKGSTNRGGGPKDIATSQFSVTVKKLEPAVPSQYYPENKKTHEALPYTSTSAKVIPFKANGKFAGLDGVYKMELYLDGVKVKEANEPNIEYDSLGFMRDEKKKLQVKTYYRSPYMKEFTLLDDKTFTVLAPPFIAVSEGDPDAGQPLQIKSALGIASPYMEVGSDHLEVESEGYFESSARKIPNKDGAYEFEAKATAKASTIKGKDPKTVNITVTDPITRQSKSFQIGITPKQTGKKGGGSGGIK